jgi:protease I
MKNTIAMVIAHQGFRDEEYWVPKAAFEKAGYQVVTVSSQAGKAMSKFGKPAAVDRVITDTKAGDYAAVVFVGGPGTSEYFNSPEAHRLAREILDEGAWLTAICIAPTILARAGLLTGKQATVFPSGQADLEQNGALYTGASVTQDGRIITADGPEAAGEFAAAVIKAMRSEN